MHAVSSSEAQNCGNVFDISLCGAELENDSFGELAKNVNHFLSFFPSKWFLFFRIKRVFQSDVKCFSWDFGSYLASPGWNVSRENHPDKRGVLKILRRKSLFSARCGVFHCYCMDNYGAKLLKFLCSFNIFLSTIWWNNWAGFPDFLQQSDLS